MCVYTNIHTHTKKKKFKTCLFLSMIQLLKYIYNTKITSLANKLINKLINLYSTILWTILRNIISAKVRGN